MGDNEEDVKRRRMLSMESSSLSFEELHSIQSLSSLSDSSLELPPQSASVRIAKTRTTQAASPQRIPSTALYVGAVDEDEDVISRDSSHFSLGLDPSKKGLNGAHRDKQTSHDKSSSSTTFERKRTISLESSDREDGGSESLMDDHMEIAALIAKAKREINQDHGAQANDSKQLSSSPFGSSTVQQKIPTNPTIISPSPQKQSIVEPFETEKRKSVATSIQRQKLPSIQTQDEVEQVSNTKHYGETSMKRSNHLTPSERFSLDFILAGPYSLQRERKQFESQREGRQSFGSRRKSKISDVQETDRQSSARKGRKQNGTHVTGEERQPGKVHRENDQSSGHKKERALRHTSISARGRKSKTMKNYLERAPVSGSEKDPTKRTKQHSNSRDKRKDEILRRVSSQPKKEQQQKIQERKSWEMDRFSQMRNEIVDETRRHTWDCEKTEQRPRSKAEITRGYKPKVMSVEINDDCPSEHRALSASKAVEKSNNDMPCRAEKRGDSSRKESRSTQTERQGNDYSTMYIPKADCRTISEKLKDSFNSERKDKVDSRISYRLRQSERQMAPENENSTFFRKEYQLESRQDDLFEGERLLHVDHNRRSEMSSLTFKCRALSEKERLMRMYQEKEKVANEFITKWSKLSETTTSGSGMRQNDHYGYRSHNKYTSEPWLSERPNDMPPWTRISSLTHDLPHTSTMAMQSKTYRPNLGERQVGSKKKRWVCDICGVANFESYAACFIHEKNCTGPVRNTRINNYPPGESSWLLNE